MTISEEAEFEWLEGVSVALGVVCLCRVSAYFLNSLSSVLLWQAVAPAAPVPANSNKSSSVPSLVLPKCFLLGLLIITL